MGEHQLCDLKSLFQKARSGQRSEEPGAKDQTMSPASIYHRCNSCVSYLEDGAGVCVGKAGGSVQPQN